MNNEWGLTEQGFRRPTYTELLDAYEYKARELFGAKANLTTRSPLGIFLRIFSWITNLLFQLIEDVYNSRFIDTAVGTSLYNLGKYIGIRLLSANKATGYIEVTGTPQVWVPEGWLVSTIAGVQFAVLQTGQIGSDGTVVVPIQAVDAGPDGNVEAGTIKEIVNPIDGIESVTNPLSIEGGRIRETDEEYRDRYYKSVDYPGGVNIEAIRAEILQNVAGVYSAEVYENDTDDYNADGMPPHSIEPVVFGGADTDIAKAIHRRRAGGPQTHGNVSVPVVAINSQIFDTKFSRPTGVPVWFRISSLQTDDTFADNGKDLVAQAIIDYIGGSVRGGLSIGQPVIFTQMHTVINGVQGVVDYKLEISPDGKVYSEVNVPIGTREKAITDSGKVVVL